MQYHIAFFTKNTLKLHEINFIKNYFNNVSINHEFKIMKMEFGFNNVRLTINCQTTHNIPNLIKALKGGSARFLYKEFPDSKIEHGSSLWDSKYYISTDEMQLDNMISGKITK
ncbi:transposase [Neobacillus cucumis]|uniref:transposase n=1 Tax=Neobacillus cucumis TaxID=1740721 RepID=UPI0035A3C862